MDTKIMYKDEFAVIGKMKEGSALNPHEWVPPIWSEAAPKFPEIFSVIRHSDNGDVAGVWGAMNDVGELNKRWDENGRYLAGCEADVDAVAPTGWTKWVIPAQTYLVADCTLETYGEVFGPLTNDPSITIVGTVHERYPHPDDSNRLELWFPIASGMMFCQSCGMPLTKDEDFGTNADGTRNTDYCCHCFGNGAFFKEETMDEMIETCIPFVSNGNPYANADEARKSMQEYFPKLKRWAK